MKGKYAYNMWVETPQGHLTCSLIVNYMHDDMIKVLELIYKTQNINNTQLEQ
jgi:hypothetical protein